MLQVSTFDLAENLGWILTSVKKLTIQNIGKTETTRLIY